MAAIEECESLPVKGLMKQGAYYAGPRRLAGHTDGEYTKLCRGGEGGQHGQRKAGKVVACRNWLVDHGAP